MAEMSDLIQTLYNSLQEKFGTPGGTVGPGGLFLAFERLGIGLSANDFKLQPSDSAFNPAIAAQHGSLLVNFCAQLDPDGFIMPRGDLSPTVTVQYDDILTAASYGIQPASDTAVANFLQSKGAARRTFDESEVPAPAAQSYWPASFDPSDWFNDQDASIWSSYSSSTAESTSPGPAPTLPTMVQTNWAWRVVTPEAVPNLQIMRTLQATPAPQRYTSDIYQASIAARPEMIAPAVMSNSIRPDVAVPAAVSVAAASPVRPTMSFAATPAAGIAFSRVPTTSPAINPARSAVIGEVNLPVGPMVRTPAPILTGMRLNPIMATHLELSSVVSNLPTQQTSSTNFQLSFQYCVANVSRAWLSSDWLTAANWYVPGLPAGGLAQGTYQKGAQKFAFLPTKLLVVKNLTITAQWSQQDRTFAQNSASLGPFSLIDTQFENDTLTAPGMQIIAWFCQVVPILPAIADPAGTTSTAAAPTAGAVPSG